jgi:ABC-type sulfate transport system substrate-binding protein
MSEIKAYSKKELTALYNVSRKTFVAWLKPFEKEIGPYNGKRFTIAQVQTIFNKIGNP